MKDIASVELDTRKAGQVRSGQDDDITNDIAQMEVPTAKTKYQGDEMNHQQFLRRRLAAAKMKKKRDGNRRC